MKFPKKDLIRLIDRGDFVQWGLTGKTRWSVHYDGVFVHENRFYLIHWSEGATEYQDEQPLEYEPDMIECPEVFPHEVTVIEYRTEPKVAA